MSDSSAGSPATLRLLGAPAWLTPKRQPWPLERRWRLAAWLAVEQEGASRDELAALFWPDRGQPAARSNLRKLLMELRALELPGLQDEQARLHWPVVSDLQALRQACRAQDGAAVAAIEWRVPLAGMEGGDSAAFDDWLLRLREQLRQGWRSSLLAHAHRQPAEQALTLTERLMAADALDEQAHAAAAAALRALGRGAEGDRLLDALRQRLREELGVEVVLPGDRPAAPGSGATTASGAPPSGTTARDAANDAAHDAVHDASGDAPTGSPVRTAIPTATDDAECLIGRDAARRELGALLGEPGCRLLTLLGPGGIGKSALALALLRDGALPGGPAAAWIALEDLGSADQVGARVARELGIAVGPRSSGDAEVTAALAARETTLVLDNAEHLEGLADWLQRLLAAAPRLRVLATSRRPLGLAGEWLFPLPPLADAGARALLVRESRLLRARHDPLADEAALQRLVQALGGLPLALRLAAAWLRHLPLATLAREVERKLDALEQEASPDERPEHAGLRATFERSWSFLPPPLQSTLAALAVCVGATALDQAQAVAAARMSQLLELAERALVNIEGEGRLVMHPLLRQFAAGKLAADPAAERAARDRHARAFGALMRPWQNFSEVDTRQALEAIAAELPNLWAAWEHALAHGLWEVLDDIAPAISNLVQARGGIAAIVARFEAAERALAAATPPPLQALLRVALEHAALRYWLAEYVQVEASARQALRAATAVRNARVVRMALNTLALAVMRQGRIEDGAQLLAQALERARADRAGNDVAAFAGNLSGVLRELGRLEEAEQLAREALGEHRARRFTIGEISALNELGLIAHAQSALDEAFDWYAQALQIADEKLQPARRAALLTHQASARLCQGRADDALALARLSQKLVEDSGLRSHEPTLRRILAEALIGAGEREAAWRQLRSAVALERMASGSTAARGMAASCAACAMACGDAATALWLLGWVEARRRAAGVRQGSLPRFVRLRERAGRALGAAASRAVLGEAESAPAEAIDARLQALLAAAPAGASPGASPGA
jgi:predicted ATPase/DNA-binding SARP family transcriptional activator